jgi:RNA polymerase sigma factor (sigma-70 family)
VTEDSDDRRSDAELLRATPDDAQAFATFYRRHVDGVLRFFRAQVREPETAADLMAETFAAALVAARRYRPGRGSPAAWLYAIARHKLIDSARRGQVRDVARRRLQMERLELDDEDFRRVDRLPRLLADREVLAALAELDQKQRSAVAARVLHQRSYADIAAEMRCSEAVVRKRVSRGLQEIRTRLEETT